jgi:hypothetical protein
MSIFRGEYDTLRDLERKSYKVFYVGIGIAGMGVVLTIVGFGLLTFIGIPLVIIGAAIFFVAMIWTSRLQKEPVKIIYCPYCSSKNDVFLTRMDFACDICRRRINITPSAEVVGAEPVEEED